MVWSNARVQRADDERFERMRCFPLAWRFRATCTLSFPGSSYAKVDTLLLVDTAFELDG